MDILERLQKWYFSQCNGDWEHEFGVSIENADNPGWIVTIDLENTELNNKKFREIEVERSTTDWFFCRIEDEKFKGFCGPMNLSEILEIFLSWVDE